MNCLYKYGLGVSEQLYSKAEPTRNYYIYIAMDFKPSQQEYSSETEPTRNIYVHQKFWNKYIPESLLQIFTYMH